jgi:hypothetical protein
MIYWSIRNKNCLWCLCLLTDWDKMSNLYKRTFHRCFLPSFGSFGHVVSEEKIFRNRPKHRHHRQFLFLIDQFLKKSFTLTQLGQIDLNLVGSIYGRSSMGNAHSVLIRNLKNQPIRNKNRLWWPCLLMDRDGMSNLYRGPSIDASY